MTVIDVLYPIAASRQPTLVGRRASPAKTGSVLVPFIVAPIADDWRVMGSI
jgi:hypothetical protein